MTALVMASEVDLALDRILEVCNTSSPPNPCDEDDYDVANISNEGVIASDPKCAQAVAIASPSQQVAIDPTANHEQPVKREHEAGEGSPGGGETHQGMNSKMKEMVASTYDYLIDDAILGLVFEAHRAAKTGLYFLFDMEDEEDDDLRLIVDEQGFVDVFGQALVPSSKNAKALSQLECICPQCHQTRLACRFAPHLEKCMGMGRNSSRIASRRLAAAAAAAAAANTSSSAWRGGHDSTPTLNGRESSDDGDSEEGQFGTDDDDDDWTGGTGFGRKKTQKKRGTAAGSTGRTPRKRGGTSKVTPKKGNTSLRSGALVGDLLLNESPAKNNEGIKKMRKISSCSKLTAITTTTTATNSYNIDMEMGNDFLSMADSYDPPSPSF